MALWMRREGAFAVRAAMLVAPLIACGESRRGSPAADSNAGATSGTAGQGASPSDAGAPGTGGTGGDGISGTPSGGQTSGGESNAGAPSAGAPPLPPVEVTAPDPPAMCDPEVCAVVSDWNVVDPGAYGEQDFHVATSADTTFVALTTSAADDRRRLVALDASGEVPIDQGLIGQTAVSGLAVDASGALHALGVRLVPAGSGETPAVHEGTLTGTDWSYSTLEGARWSLALEVDPSQRSLAHARNTMGAPILLARERSDPWSSKALPAGFEQHQLALDARGMPTFSSAIGSTLSVFDDAGSTIFTNEPAGASDLTLVRVARGQPLSIESGRELAFAALGDDGLQVLLGDRGGADAISVTVPNTAALAFDCPDRVEGTGAGCGVECAPSCRSSGTGLTPVSVVGTARSSAFALARTDDGAIWLAYLVSDLEVTFSYVWGNTGAGCSTCGIGGYLQEGSTALKVVRITADGSSLLEAMSVPIAMVGADPNGRAELLVEGRAFGRRVVFAVVQRFADGYGLRVVTLDAL